MATKFIKVCFPLSVFLKQKALPNTIFREYRAGAFYWQGLVKNIFMEPVLGFYPYSRLDP